MISVITLINANYTLFRSSNYYSTPGLLTPSTVNNSANYDMSEWQREKERRRQELLAKRSKVMNRLLELRLEKERRRTAVETETLSTLSLRAKILF